MVLVWWLFFLYKSSVVQCQEAGNEYEVYNKNLLPDFTCPDNKNWRYSMPGSCSFFYHCIEGQAFKQACPDGLFFNKEAGNSICDIAFKVDCQEPDISYRSYVLPEPSSHSQVICPPGSEDSTHPNEDDCSSFYHCNDGQAELLTCQDGLFYNHEESSPVCDYPVNVKCATES